MRSAVVVGAGVGGLAAAGALARGGWQVTLLERDDRVRADSAAWLIWANGVRALRALGLADGLAAIATPFTGHGVRRPDGQWLVQPDASDQSQDEPPLVVHREDLRDALFAGLGDRVEILTGVEVRSCRQLPDERPVVADGRRRWEADLIVVADGVDSTLRRRLAPAATVVSADCAAWRAVIPWYRASTLHLPGLEQPGAGPTHNETGPAFGGETIGAGHRFLYASLGDRGSAGGSTRGGVYWAATVPGAPRPEPPSTQLTLLRRWFADWHTPIGDLLAATEPDDLVQHSVAELWPVPAEFGYPAGPGGFVLLGDAAHAMTHHLGQGACLALEDAATLRTVMLDAIPGPSLVAALTSYTSHRRQRVVRVVRQSRRAGSVLRARNGLAARAREVALGALSPRLLGRVAGGVTRWEPPTLG